MFFPDQHLGRNTALGMGITLDQMPVWDPYAEALGGSSEEQLARSKVILWKGHCSVHTRFTVRQIEQLRAQHPGIRVIVHPETPWEVVQAADDSGSTEYIIKTVKESPVGSIWAVGTEIHLVNRLARQIAPDRTVLSDAAPDLLGLRGYGQLDLLHRAAVCGGAVLPRHGRYRPRHADLRALSDDAQHPVRRSDDVGRLHRYVNEAAPRGAASSFPPRTIDPSARWHPRCTTSLRKGG